MKIYIGSDYRGYEAKKILIEYLRNKGHHIVDNGYFRNKSSDYTKQVCNEVIGTDEAKGIIICGSGISASISANRHKGIRCILGRTKYDVKIGRQKNNANVLALCASYNPDPKIVDTFLETEFKK